MNDDVGSINGMMKSTVNSAIRKMEKEIFLPEARRREEHQSFSNRGRQEEIKGNGWSAAFD